LLGGFDRAKEELRLVENLVIAADSQSKAAADYGAHIMRHLEVFNSVKVMDASKVQRGDLERLKYGGYLTLSI
jgi:glucosamine 6-phosphate synthetase-like amidotransferase/phosphosugar isomerase protein